MASLFNMIGTGPILIKKWLLTFLIFSLTLAVHCFFVCFVCFFVYVYAVCGAPFLKKTGYLPLSISLTSIFLQSLLPNYSKSLSPIISCIQQVMISDVWFVAFFKSGCGVHMQFSLHSRRNSHLLYVRFTTSSSLSFTLLLPHIDFYFKLYFILGFFSSLVYGFVSPSPPLVFL